MRKLINSTEGLERKILDCGTLPMMWPQPNDFREKFIKELQAYDSFGEDLHKARADIEALARGTVENEEFQARIDETERDLGKELSLSEKGTLRAMDVVRHWAPFMSLVIDQILHGNPSWLEALRKNQPLDVPAVHKTFDELQDQWIREYFVVVEAA